MKTIKLLVIKIFYILSASITVVLAGDVTNLVFGSIKDAIPAAYGDFNSDEFTDVFIIRNNSKTVEILFGNDVEPLLNPKKDATCHFHKAITNVMPGDFDGDSFMDVLVTIEKERGSDERHIYINWGGLENLTCADDNKEPLIRMHGEPLALDYDRNMILDLFGMTVEKERMFWIFDKDKRTPDVVPMQKLDGDSHNELSVPHSHAILDLNEDHLADLFVTTKTHFEVWLGTTTKENQNFEYSHKIDWPVGRDIIVGQSVFLDVELKGKLNLILPICFDQHCSNSTILMHAGDKREHFHNMQVNLKDNDNQQWGFTVPDKSNLLTQTITIRGGDFNMDGYPDLIATLTKTTGNRQTQTFLLENIPCTGSHTCDKLTRTFAVKWKALSPFLNGTVMGSFYDFYQDGILDVVLVEQKGDKYRPLGFRNTLDYDANFVKVIVLTGLTNKFSPSKKTPLGRNIKRWGTNLPGPFIRYVTITQEGHEQHGASTQLPQSAYFSLHLPYTIFGLGRTPNFVDSLTVGLANRSKIWTQLIPNSQMIVIPKPIQEPDKWKAQLFVTPSKLILKSVFALSGICLFILIIILVLYVKEKREDKIEKLQEAHRFHFDAM